MRERAVGLRHAVRVLALLDGVSPVVRRVEQLGREPLRHRLLVAVARGRDQPAYAERLAPRRADLDRHLIGGAADAARTHLDRRHDVVERLLEHAERVLLGLALDDVERAVDDVLRHRLLAGVHDRVHELADHHVPELRIGNDLAFLGTVTAGHRKLFLFLVTAELVPAIHVLIFLSRSPDRARPRLARPGMLRKEADYFGLLAPY